MCVNKKRREIVQNGKEICELINCDARIECVCIRYYTFYPHMVTSKDAMIHYQLRTHDILQREEEKAQNDGKELILQRKVKNAERWGPSLIASLTPDKLKDIHKDPK